MTSAPLLRLTCAHVDGTSPAGTRLQPLRSGGLEALEASTAAVTIVGGRCFELLELMTEEVMAN